MARPVGRSNPTSERFLSAIRTYLPGAWFAPSKQELIALYRLRYKVAVDEGRHDCALVFLDRILEADPGNLEARLLRAELYHRFLGDVGKALDQYTKVIRLASSQEPIRARARQSLAELMALVS